MNSKEIHEILQSMRGREVNVGVSGQPECIPVARVLTDIASMSIPLSVEAGWKVNLEMLGAEITKQYGSFGSVGMNRDKLAPILDVLVATGLLGMDEKSGDYVTTLNYEGLKEVMQQIED